MFAPSDAKYERTTQTSPDDHAGIVRTEHGQPIRSFEQRECLAHRFGEIVPQMVGDEVGNDLGVGVAVEDYAFILELALEGRIVFDDPVVDHGDLPIAAAVR